MTFGEELRRRRRAANKTLHQMGNFLGLSLSYMADVESSRRAPLTDERIKALGEFLALSERDLNDLRGLALSRRKSFVLQNAENASSEALELGAALERRWPQLTEQLILDIRRLLASTTKADDE